MNRRKTEPSQNETLLYLVLKSVNDINVPPSRAYPELYAGILRTQNVQYYRFSKATFITRTRLGVIRETVKEKTLKVR